MAGLRPTADGGDGSCSRGVGDAAVSSAMARTARALLSPAVVTGMVANARASETGAGAKPRPCAAGERSGCVFLTAGTVARAAGGLRLTASVLAEESGSRAALCTAGRIACRAGCRTTGAGVRRLIPGEPAADASSPWMKGAGSRAVGAVLGIWLSASAASSAAVVWRLFCSAAERMVDRWAAAARSKSAAVALGADVARSGVRAGLAGMCPLAMVVVAPCVLYQA